MKSKITASFYLKVGRRTVAVSHIDKILFPQSKITKGDIIDYYHKIAPIMLPKIKDRPVSMVRYPEGISQEGFFQKNIADYFPDWIKTVAIKRVGKASIRMLVCNDAATLVYLANQACLTPHIWLSRNPRLTYPDRMIFDLDPPERFNFRDVMEGAQTLRGILEELGLSPFLMTTGSRGLHVVIPLKPVATFTQVRIFARQVATYMAEQEPGAYTIEQRKAERKERLFIDYLRNGYAQTGVAPYAVRAHEGAPVATPLAWHELSPGLTSQRYTIKNIFERLQRVQDPWSTMQHSARTLTVATKRLKLLMAR